MLHKLYPLKCASDRTRTAPLCISLSFYLLTRARMRTARAPPPPTRGSLGSPRGLFVFLISQSNVQERYLFPKESRLIVQTPTPPPPSSNHRQPRCSPLLWVKFPFSELLFVIFKARLNIDVYQVNGEGIRVTSVISHTLQREIVGKHTIRVCFHGSIV